MNKRKLLVLGICLIGVSAQAACVVKPGFIGGKMKLPAGFTPVCGSEKDKFLSGLKTAYRQAGKTLPNPKWFELYTFKSSNSAASLKSVDVLFENGYKVSDDQSTPLKFGYVFTNYKHTKTGQWLMSVMLQRAPYEVTYRAYIGY